MFPYATSCSPRHSSNETNYIQLDTALYAATNRSTDNVSKHESRPGAVPLTRVSSLSVLLAGFRPNAACGPPSFPAVSIHTPSMPRHSTSANAQGANSHNNLRRGMLNISPFPGFPGRLLSSARNAISAPDENLRHMQAWTGV